MALDSRFLAELKMRNGIAETIGMAIQLKRRWINCSALASSTLAREPV